MSYYVKKILIYSTNETDVNIPSDEFDDYTRIYRFNKNGEPFMDIDEIEEIGKKHSKRKDKIIKYGKSYFIKNDYDRRLCIMSTEQNYKQREFLLKLIDDEWERRNGEDLK